MKIYHVTSEWDGGDLTAIAGKEWCDGIAVYITEKWGCDPWAYYCGDGRYVHCHSTLVEAIEFRDEWCEAGIVLEIDATDLDVEIGQEYPHPVVRREIPADCIRVLKIVDYIKSGS